MAQSTHVNQTHWRPLRPSGRRSFSAELVRHAELTQVTSHPHPGLYIARVGAATVSINVHVSGTWCMWGCVALTGRCVGLSYESNSDVLHAVLLAGPSCNL